MKAENSRVQELYGMPIDELKRLYRSTTGIEANKSMSKIEICRRIERTEYQRRRSQAKIPLIKGIF